MKNEIKSTAHYKYRYQYHIVFVPKYRRKVIYKEWRANIIQIIRKLCKEKGWNHSSTSISRLYPYDSQYSIIFKRSTVYRISQEQEYHRHANLKYKYGRRNFWVRGYFVDTMGRNEKVIKEYIKS